MYIHGPCLVAVLHVIYILECSALSITIHVDVNLYFCATTSTRLTHTQPKNERWGLLSYLSRDHNLESGLSGCYFEGCHARALTVDVQNGRSWESVGMCTLIEFFSGLPHSFHFRDKRSTRD